MNNNNVNKKKKAVTLKVEFSEGFVFPEYAFVQFDNIDKNISSCNFCPFFYLDEEIRGYCTACNGIINSSIYKDWSSFKCPFYDKVKQTIKINAFGNMNFS